MPARKSKASKAAKAVSKPRRYRRKASSNVPELASLSCKRTLQATGGANFAVNTLFSLMNTQLTDYPRAVQVAQAYQHYRIKQIAVTFKPTYDTFTQGGQSKMNMYWMIDKAGAIPSNINLEGLKAMGARPRQLDEKNMVVKWRPSVLESTMYAGGVNADTPSKYLISPWLATTAVPIQPGAFVPSGVDHLGLYWYCEQLVTATATQYQVEVEVQFQFKKPLAQITSEGIEAIPAIVAPLNGSSDGIVGGVDGQ